MKREIEWVETPWSDFKPHSGINIRVESPSGFAMLRGQLDSKLELWCNPLSKFASMNFALWVERKREPEPTEPGLYRLDTGMVVELNVMGWQSPNHMNYVTEYVERSYTFQRLEPVVGSTPEGNKE